MHTYFAFVARVVAIETLSIARNEPADQPSGWASMDDKALRDALARLDRGSVPRGMLVSNLFEADVFSWWAPMADNETLDAVRGLLEQLGRFAFPSAAYGIQPSTDVLRELYLRLVPRSLRKRLGEYPTPPWLAEACLASLREEGIDLLSSTVLDPCCGTGSFVLPLLKQRVADLRRRKGDDITSEDVQGVIDGLAGFDINPLAVVATRANFLVALGPLAQIGEFSLRIWRTDSIVLPNTQPSQTRMGDPRLYCSGYLELTTSLPDPFPIPEEFAKVGRIGAVRRAIEDSLLVGGGTRAVVEALAAEYGPAGIDPCADERRWAEISGIVEVLHERMALLAESGRNGVWAGIVENAFAPLFTDRFDLVVGNPPWLGYAKLPRRWRKDAERLWRRYGLWDYPLAPGEQRKSRAQYNDLAGSRLRCGP